jgi:Mg2+-importing ATPase
MGIATDNVDRDWESTPHRWDIRMIRNFMLRFGLLSTVFDLLTFAVLLHLAGESADRFRTGWFVESLLTELLILFVIRTYRPFFASRPGRFLVWSSAAMVLVTLALPYSPLAALFSLVPLPGTIMAAILLITASYLVVSEFTKRAFFRRLETGQAK